VTARRTQSARRGVARIAAVLIVVAASTIGAQTGQDSTATVDTVRTMPVSTGATYTPAEDTSRTPRLAEGKRQQVRKLRIIKRKVNYREQIFVALGVMAFVAVMMTTTQAWNPN